MFEHVLKSTIKYGKDHNLKWDSSGHVNGGDFRDNMHMAHGYFTSGMLYVQYEKFSSQAKFGSISDKTMNHYQEVKGYRSVVRELVV